MKYIRFGLLSLLLLLSLSMVLTGCSSEETQTGDLKDDTTITFWHTASGTSEEAINAVVKAFEEKHSDIKVKNVFVAGGEDGNKKLLTAIAGGNPPDAAFFGRFKIGSWATQGALKDLTDLAKRDNISKSDYYPSTWEEATYKEKLYGVPISTDSRLLFYNKDQFKEVDLDPDNPPETIDELEMAAKKLTIKNGSRFKRIGFIPWAGQGWLYTWGWNFGGEFYNPETGKVTASDPKIVDALQWEVDYAKEYNIEDIASFTSSQGSGAMSPFISGRLSMIVSGPALMSAINKFKPDLNYGVTPIPTPTGKNHTTWSGGFSIAIPKGATHTEAAWEFAKFFGSKEGQEIYSKISRDLSTIPSVNENLYSDDPTINKFVEALPNAHYRPSIAEGQLLWNELTDAVEAATRGNGEAKELLDEVSKKVNKALQK